MLEILKFVFSSFWIWLGTAVFLGIIAEGLSGMVRRFTK